jgi:hypothetical protein
MKSPTIEVNQQFGQIGIKITPPNLQLAINPPDLQIHIQKPDLDLRITKPDIIIDLHESFDSMGLKDIASTEKTVRDEANQTVAKGVVRRVQEGIALEKAKGPSVTQLAVKASKPEEKQMGIGLMPARPPKITAKLGAVKGIYSAGDVAVNLDLGDVKGSFTWGKVDIYMERQPQIDIKA